MKAWRKETTRVRAENDRRAVREVRKHLRKKGGAAEGAYTTQDVANKIAAATLRKYVQPGRPVGSGSLGAQRRAEAARKAEAANADA